MSNSGQHLVNRNGVFHYRRRVPADIEPHVGQRWWKRSLATGSQREAETRARDMAVKHDALIVRLRGLPAADRYAALQRTLDDAREGLQAAAEADRWRSEQQPVTPARSLATARAGQDALQLFEAASSVAEKLKRVMLAAAEQRLDTLPEAERAAVRQSGGIEAFFEQIRAATQALESSRNGVTLRKALGGATRVDDEEEAVLKVRTRHVAKDQQTLVKLGLGTDDDDGFEEPNNPRIKTATEQWFIERKQGLDAVKRHRVSINRFVELHGNVPVGGITKQMVRDYRNAIEKLADHRKVPADKRGGLFDPGVDVPRVAAPTVERHLISIKALLTFCIEQDWLAANAATGLRAPKDTRPKASKRRSFTREERNKLLVHAVEEYGEDADITWLVKLGAYTGCRLEELAQLARTNVRLIDGVWAVEIDDLDGRHVKTDDSVKTIPLHPAIRDDFISWVQSGTGRRVFTSFVADDKGRYANELSGAFGRLMDRAGLTDPRLVFHSLRHTLKREMSNARIDPDVRRVILGHAPKDAHDGYDGHSLEAIAEEFARLPPMFG